MVRSILQRDRGECSKAKARDGEEAALPSSVIGALALALRSQRDDIPVNFSSEDPVRTSTKFLKSVLLVMVFAACGGAESEDEADRDITLAPAESLMTMDDQPTEDPASESTSAGTPTPAAPVRRAPPAPPAPLRLGEGTVLVVQASDTISSRTHAAGESVTATVGEDVLDASGRVVVPAGAVLEGTITEIKPAPNPEASGTISLSFTTLRIGDERFSIVASVDSLETVRQGRGVTGGDAAKVGVGAAAGAIAGRVIGGDATGAVVGGVIGAATGAGVAAVTKDSDIVVPEGALIRLVLTEAFERPR